MFLLSPSCSEQANSTLPAELAKLNCEADRYPGLQGFQKIMGKTNSYLFAEGNVDTGLPNGFWKYYYPDGKLWKEGNYSNGRLNGFWKLYYENGNLREEGHYEDCERNGFWKVYSKSEENAVVFEGNLENGKVKNY